jgi:molybdopterin-guanine dinucleotide biosynthesis protein A
MILGAVLVGGRSSRFGSDKAAAEWNGRTLAEHAAALVGQHVDAVVTVGGEGEVPDLPRAGLGPLGGIAGVLDHAAGHGFTSVLTIGCDMPRVPSELLTALLRRAPAYCEDAPVLGHWPAALDAQLMAWVEGGAAQGSGDAQHRWKGRGGEDRSVRRWAREIGALPIASPVPLDNVNRPEDLMTL